MMRSRSDSPSPVFTGSGSLISDQIPGAIQYDLVENNIMINSSENNFMVCIISLSYALKKHSKNSHINCDSKKFIKIAWE